MPTAYCEPSDVQAVLQESDGKFGTNELSTTNVEAAIYGVSEWFGKSIDGHFYDSNAGTSDLIDSSPATANNRLLSLPSSPHRQDGQLHKVAERTRTQRSYPVAQVGQYTRTRLPKWYVESVDRLDVRQLGGDTVDWVASSDHTEGRGEDYYYRTEGGSKGHSHLYVHIGSLGPHKDFDDIIEVDLTYGLDYQDTSWDDVKRGVAALAGAQLVADDDVLAGLPDQGSLMGVDTQVQQLVNQALGLEDGMGGYLSPYFGEPVA